MRIQLPLFRARPLDKETEEPLNVFVEGDFVYTPSWVSERGAVFSPSYEIWARKGASTTDDFYIIDPESLEISFDEGQTFDRFCTFTKPIEIIQQ